MLEETLNSHRHAISLNPTNTDILFNTAQVLTSLAEAGLEDGTQEAAKTPARSLLEEAVDIFTGCLQKQQQEYEQMQAEIAKAQALGEYQEAWEGDRPPPAEAKEQDDADAASSSSEGAGDWATVEEPVTPVTILETCTAQLGALVTLLGLYTPEDLPSIEKKAQDGLLTATETIPALIDIIDGSPESDSEDEPEAGPTLSIGQPAATEEASTSPREDAVLAAANFQASIAEAMYRSGRSTSSQYAQQVEQTFSTLLKESQSTNPGLAYVNIRSSYADALIDLASSIADSPQYTVTSPAFVSDLDIQWTALSQAQKTLTELSSAPLSSMLSASRLADIFLARGDTELFRFRIAVTPGAKAAWANSKAVVVANAGVFYRGARSYAQNAGAAQTRATADAKAVVAEILKEVSSGSNARKETWKGRSADVAAVLGQMVEEGIVAEENAQGLLDFAE